MGDIQRKTVFEQDLFKFEYQQFINAQEVYAKRLLKATKSIQTNFRMIFQRKNFIKKK